MLKQMMTQEKKPSPMKEPALVTMAAAEEETIPAMEMGEELERGLTRKARRKRLLV